MSPSLTTTDGRSVLRMERRLAHPPEKVWRAVVEPERLLQWFPTAMTPELRTGGAVTFGFGDPGTVTDLEPGRVLAYTWGTDHLRWELHADGGGTLLVLVHSFDDRAGAASFAAGWHVCLAALDLALAGRAGEDPGIDHVALHEQYVCELGLDTGSAVRTPDGWQVRFERQLTRPTQAVWSALAAAPPWPGAGAVVVREEPAGGPDEPASAVLEHDVADGRVRWELGPGTGHGPRLVVTWVGSGAAARDSALEQAPRRVSELLARAT